jgi:hypothetical protein
VPLDLGGAPADLRNLRLQPWPEAREKDALEAELSKAVCENEVALSEAQSEIATDWRAACREWISPQALRRVDGPGGRDVQLLRGRAGGAAPGVDIRLVLPGRSVHVVLLHGATPQKLSPDWSRFEAWLLE